MCKCSAAFYITLGFVSLWTTVPSTGSCDCSSENLNLLKHKCNNTEGVSDLACYIKYIKNQRMSFCEWTGNMSTSYTLYTIQRKCSCIAVHQKDNIWTSIDFRVVLQWNVTAHVIATSKDQSSCTYKNFSGIPSMMTMCGPHSTITHKRSSGNLTVLVEWGNEKQDIKSFLVKYREFNTTRWKEQQSIDNKKGILLNLTPSLQYELQTQCVSNEKCVHCPLSKVIIVPPELIDAPSIQLETQDHQHLSISPGQRKVVVKWEYANSEAVDNYSVTVRKVSGEPSNRDSFSTKDSSLTLVLSYSAYNISIKALNHAGSSPVSSITIEQMDEWRDMFGPFTVNITSNNSFSLSWSSSDSSVCYSVEWWAKGQRPAFRPFYLQMQKEKTVKTESIFRPYARYYFFLHVRPYIDTCNMKNVNGSETTRGTAQTYFIEGSPISAPGNVSTLNITQHSSVITWSPVSEEDLRGFLLGYYIYLTEDNNETSFKVDPSVNSYELQNLESNSVYRVQLSAFTAAGEGERSDYTHFVTNPPDFTALNSIIAAVVVGIIILLLAVHFSIRLLHRAKKLLWPSIPNPENSNAVQKIEIAYELGIVEPLIRQRLEESEGCDSSTVCVIGSKREASLLSSPPTTLLLSEDEDSTSIPEEIASPDIPTQVPTREPAVKETFLTDLNKTDSILSTSFNEEVTSFKSKDPGETASNPTVSDFIPASQPAVVFMSDYTTMEIFQQVTMTGIQGPSIQAVKPELVAVHTGQDYIRQSYFLQETVKEPPGAFNGTDFLNTEITVL
ncbi:interleukin-31 receptor subunit alpha-like isoform X1 [Carassius auratus]|uniref:Interleukin-31 receptor subunit alpha-like isoform X1 n=2 Tax=Carassius auratus TaxID=7957 RepID=A0A6P6NPS6_CARAU|nr:interleukin-31 receptor subunit alpha-like isoform X1 [Carassius auratus]